MASTVYFRIAATGYSVDLCSDLLLRPINSFCVHSIDCMQCEIIVFAKGIHPGATWRKADLQIHSPRDPQWEGGPHLAGGNAEAEAARATWADKLVAECVRRGLTAIAITDHHDFCFVHYIKEAIERLGPSMARPWLFPGIEVTCDDSVQCLMLFDATTPPEVFDRLFGGHLQSVTKPDHKTPTNPQAQLCGKDVGSFLQGVASDANLADCSIVLPHGTGGGHKTIVRMGFHTRFRSLPFDGVYAEKAFVDIDDATKRKVYGQALDWGDRRRGIVTTGDNRVESFAELGANPCWIRLGEPTAEAIRQALLADEARIAYVEPSLPNQRILKLEIESTLTGHGFVVVINDGFTALIGGRGSGKSALLEYLRYGLGRSAGDIRGEADERRSREQDLVADTLQGGTVRVTLERDGVIETWRRTGDKRDTIEVTLPDGSNDYLTIPAAQERFRARAFYQKQLSTLVGDRKTAADQITGIAAAEAVDRLQVAEKDIAGAKRQVQTDLQQIVEYWVAQSEHARSVAATADLRRRIDAVQKRLEESGLKPEHQQLLATAPLYNLAEGLTVEAKESIRADAEVLTNLCDQIPSLDPSSWQSVRDIPEVGKFLAAVEAAKATVSLNIQNALLALVDLSKAQVDLDTTFKARKATFDAEHRQAVAQQANLKSLLDESTRLVGELKSAEAVERRSASRVEGLAQAPATIEKSRRRLAEQAEGLAKILREAASRVQEMSGGLLRADVRLEQCPEEYKAALMAICEGHRIRDAQSRCEDRIDEVFAGGQTSWSTAEYCRASSTGSRPSCCAAC